MPPRMLPSSANCLTTSDLDVPIATSDPLPEQPQSSPRRSPGFRDKTVKSPRRRRRAATTTPISRFGNNSLIDTFRDALSDGDLPPPKYSKFDYDFREPEELPQPPEPEPEPLPRASLSPPPELADKAASWFRDRCRFPYAYPPEHPEDPQWFEGMFSRVVAGHDEMKCLLKELRADLASVLAEMTLANVDADMNIALYQEMLQNIHTLAGTKFTRALTDTIGCWHVEETDDGVEVLYDPEKGERLEEEKRTALRRNAANAGLAAMNDLDHVDPYATPRGENPTSPAPESPSHAPSVRAQKRRQERPRAPPPKRPRVFPPIQQAPVVEVRDDSTLPPSSPVPTLPSSSSPGRTGNTDPAAPPASDPAALPASVPATAPVTATTSLASLNLELNFKPSSSNYVSDPARPGLLRDDSSGFGASVDPLASGDPVDSAHTPDPEPETVPEPSPAHIYPYDAWRMVKEKSVPWNPPSTIPRRPSEDDIQIVWSPERVNKAEGSKKRARDDGEDDNGDDDEGDSGIIVPRRTAANAVSPFRGVDDSVEVEESVSAAIGAAHRAAAKAKAKARKPTKEELEERETMAYIRKKLQEPHYFLDT